MRKSRFTETQIVKILKEVEEGRLVKEVCREYGISDATYYNWKSKYGGMEASDVKRHRGGQEGVPGPDRRAATAAQPGRNSVESSCNGPAGARS
jgi:putative transposase